jgi:hypothetical protein
MDLAEYMAGINAIVTDRTLTYEEVIERLDHAIESAPIAGAVERIDGLKERPRIHHNIVEDAKRAGARPEQPANHG